MFNDRLAVLFKRATYLRILCDLVTIHICMLAAFPLAILCQLTIGREDAATHLLRDYWTYYWSFFMPLSLGFPALFLLAGLYSETSFNAGRYKSLRTACSVGTSIILFFILDWLIFAHTFSSRILVFLFCGLVMIAIPATRVAKAVIVAEMPNTSEGASPVPNEPSARTMLIVGGAGYIGSILSRALLSAGWRVRVLDKLVYGDSAIRDLVGMENFELLVGDCRNIQAVAGAVKGVDVIVHLAAIVGDPACDLDQQTTLEINYAATRMLAEVAKGHGIRRFVFASSCSVYGATDEFVTELSHVAPISLYGQTKVDSEKTLLEARSEKFAPTILRFATVFGHSYRPRFDLVVNLLTAKAHEEKVITIFNGEQWRPFIHVRDVVRAIVATVNAPIDVVDGQIFNVGDSSLNWTLSDIAMKVRSLMPDTEIVRIENSDRRNYRVCFEKIRTELAFHCEITIEEGICEMKEAFDEHQIADYKSLDYHNQRFLLATGSPANVSDVDAKVMAAFSGPSGSAAAHA